MYFDTLKHLGGLISSALQISEPKPDLQSSLDLEHLIRWQFTEQADSFDCWNRDHILDVECTGLEESRCDNNFEPRAARAGCMRDYRR